MFRVERRDGVAVLHMDDGKVNAMGLDFLDHFPKAWEQAAGSPVVLAGNAKAFGAGLDLNALAAMDGPQLAGFTWRFMDIFRLVLAHPRPVVAGVDRAALAGGAVLALCADFRLATPSAKMGVTEVPVGVPFPEPVLALARSRLPAPEHARIALRGDIVAGQDLVARGWAERIVEPTRLLDECVALAAGLGAHSPLAYAKTKEQLHRGVLASFASFDDAAWAKDLEHPDSRAALARTLERLAKR
ncbi:MAG: enoyl-CoA hydratase/isomerase family protein [Halobacteriales archaeon]|nr:enoyl-CoA hydratase/isomerase family protein [Halobacteriales archaeon]